MNNSFLIEDKYREFTPAINKVINDFNSKGELIKGTRNTIKKINIENLGVNIKRFKSPNIFNKIIYTFFRSSKANRSYNYAKKLIDNGTEEILVIDDLSTRRRENIEGISQVKFENRKIEEIDNLEHELVHLMNLLRLCIYTIMHFYEFTRLCIS